jgi:hypothetical protein
MRGYLCGRKDWNPRGEVHCVIEDIKPYEDAGVLIRNGRHYKFDGAYKDKENQLAAFFTEATVKVVII